MKLIKVLGSGCAKCNQTVEFIKEIAQQEGAEIELQKVTEPIQIMQYNVLSTPAIVIEEKVVHSGSIPKKEQILTWL
ncbi:MAG: thioredoxin family protein [SAR324 cluster bacterium]|nr:thioredoxin family protein [SAR324 cluster bacterium]